jgi:hypothetical protein
MDEDFLPERLEAEEKHAKKLDTTMVLDKQVDQDQLKPKELGGKMYKYELPLVNEPISFKSNSALLKKEDAE